MQTGKIMHDWLLIGHVQKHVTGMGQCPGYPCRDETIVHLLRCPNQQMRKCRLGALKEAMNKGMKKKKIPL